MKKCREVGVCTRNEKQKVTVSGFWKALKRRLAARRRSLSKLYDMLAIEIARRASCTAIRYADVLKTPEPKELCMQKAASFRVPVCEKCGANMVLRTGQSGARKGQKFWGCSNFPACRYTKNYEEKKL